VSDGLATATAPPITITAGSPPVVTMTAPPAGTTYRAGDVIAFSGSATDAEDGSVGAAALQWQVVMRHIDHAHPFFGPVTGIANGMVTIPATGHGPENTFYELELTATDSDGLTSTGSTFSWLLMATWNSSFRKRRSTVTLTVAVCTPSTV